TPPNTTSENLVQVNFQTKFPGIGHETGDNRSPLHKQIFVGILFVNNNKRMFAGETYGHMTYNQSSVNYESSLPVTIEDGTYEIILVTESTALPIFISNTFTITNDQTLSLPT